MSGAYFALTFAAALNPKLLAIDLLLAENRRLAGVAAGGRLSPGCPRRAPFRLCVV